MPTRKGASRIGGAHQKSFLTSAELAELLGVSETTLATLAREGRGPQYVRLPGVKGRLYRWRDLESWMDSHVYSSQSDETVRKDGGV